LEPSDIRWPSLPPRAIRRLGGRHWNLLHRLIYVTACAGDSCWLVKAISRFRCAMKPWRSLFMVRIAF
jgi:DMSO/TMAO reductase YedYZ heme-binding membrane subunit